MLKMKKVLNLSKYLFFQLTFSDETKVPVQNYNNTPGLIVIPKATSSDKEVNNKLKRFINL